MDVEEFSSNWALIVAAVPALIAVILVARFLLIRSARGQLREVLKGYRTAQKELDETRKLRRKTVGRFGKLTANAGNTRPRLLQEAREAAEDAQALEKIASDRVQVTANHVRRVIFEEFPPVKQKRLREKYLPQDEADGRPCNF